MCVCFPVCVEGLPVADPENLEGGQCGQANGRDSTTPINSTCHKISATLGG